MKAPKKTSILIHNLWEVGGQVSVKHLVGYVSSAVKIHAYRPSYSIIGISSKEVIAKIYLSGYSLLEHHLHSENLKINKPHTKKLNVQYEGTY